MREYRKKNPLYRAKVDALAGKRKKARYAEVVLPLKAAPCADCGGRFPEECMDFDHVRGTKRFSISKSCRLGTDAQLLEEIAKCELVCANCHRTRTVRRARAKSAPIAQS